MPDEYLSPNTGALATALRERLFRSPAGRRLIGAEVELLPLDPSTLRPCTLFGARGSSLSVVRRAAVAGGWTELHSDKGTPSFAIPGDGTITFEPGGQIEYSSPACASVTELLRRLRHTVQLLRCASVIEGVELVSLGMHPCTRVRDVPLQLAAPRYRRMAEYLANFGEHGARMMRQSASFQVSVDLDEDAEQRWRVLNATAPYLTAIFANSPFYGGEESPHRSTRAHAWRELDPARTGIFDGGDAACTYLGFALSAPAMLHPPIDGRTPTFGELLRAGAATAGTLDAHLSTLFPDVRPRGYLEIRSMDAVPDEWFPAPLALVSGITYDARALREAEELLGEGDDELLVRAGRDALRDETIATVALSLVEIAVRGCERLGEAYFAPEDLERARDYFEAYTSRGRSPADDLSLDVPTSAASTD